MNKQESNSLTTHNKFKAKRLIPRKNDSTSLQQNSLSEFNLYQLGKESQYQERGQYFICSRKLTY